MLHYSHVFHMAYYCEAVQGAPWRSKNSPIRGRSSPKTLLPSLRLAPQVPVTLANCRTPYWPSPQGMAEWPAASSLANQLGHLSDSFLARLMPGQAPTCVSHTTPASSLGVNQSAPSSTPNLSASLSDLTCLQVRSLDEPASIFS